MLKMVSTRFLFLDWIAHSTQRKECASEEQSAPRAISSVPTEWELTRALCGCTVLAIIGKSDKEASNLRYNRSLSAKSVIEMFRSLNTWLVLAHCDVVNKASGAFQFPFWETHD